MPLLWWWWVLVLLNIIQLVSAISLSLYTDSLCSRVGRTILWLQLLGIALAKYDTLHTSDHMLGRNSGLSYDGALGRMFVLVCCMLWAVNCGNHLWWMGHVRTVLFGCISAMTFVFVARYDTCNKCVTVTLALDYLFPNTFLHAMVWTKLACFSQLSQSYQKVITRLYYCKRFAFW